MHSRRRTGFTLIELMTVIAIIGVLIGLLLPVLQHVRKKGRERQCNSNMRQIWLSMNVYRNDNEKDGDYFPYRITWMLRDGYIDNVKIFLCPMDSSKGAEGGKPPKSVTQYKETDERGSPAIPGTCPSSYMYEFSGAPCCWSNGSYGGFYSMGAPPYPRDDAYYHGGPGQATWGEVKWKQLWFGDSYLHANLPAYDAMELKGYPLSLFPVLRCFWHQQNPDSDTEKDVFNQSFEGRSFKSGARWETSYKN